MAYSTPGTGELGGSYDEAFDVDSTEIEQQGCANHEDWYEDEPQMNEDLRSPTVMLNIELGGVKRASFSKILGSKTIHVSVGSGECTSSFRIHKRLLCSYADEDIGAFSCVFQGEVAVELPYEEPVLFSHVVQWLYTGNIDMAAFRPQNGKDYGFALLYLLAERLRIPKFKHFCFHQIQHTLGKTSWPSKDTLLVVFEYIVEDCELQSYLLDLCAHRVLARACKRTDGWLESLDACQTLALAFAKTVSLRSSQGKQSVHPYDALQAEQEGIGKSHIQDEKT